MKFLPSKFTTGNFAIATLIPLLFVATLYVLNTDFVYAYICGAVTFYATIKFYHHRVRRHEYLNPPSLPQSICNFQTHLTQMQTELDNISFRVSCYTPTVGAE